jgi:outer membrane protein assembly factor BamD
VYVAEYYLKRGAWVGAINRSKYAIENYDGAPQIKRALEIMSQSYRKLGMDDLAADSDKVLKENYAKADTVGQDGKKKSWWKIW